MLLSSMGAPQGCLLALRPSPRPHPWLLQGGVGLVVGLIVCLLQGAVRSWRAGVGLIPVGLSWVLAPHVRWVLQRATETPTSEGGRS